MLRVPAAGSPVWIDGRGFATAPPELPLFDPGVLAGLGVYETLGVHDGRCLEWGEHLARLRRGAERLGVPLPAEPALAGAAERIAREAAGERGWVKLVATRGGGCAVFGGPVDPAEQGRPASAVLLAWRRSRNDPLAGLKTLCGAPFALGREQARARGADEGLWLNDRGHLAEGCSSNVFVVHRRKLYTASERDGILPGITRALALRAARRLGLAAHVGKLRLRRLERADEAFLTSSVLGLRPLVRYEGRAVGRGEPGPVSLALARELRRLRQGGDEAPAATRGGPPRGGTGRGGAQRDRAAARGRGGG